MWWSPILLLRKLSWCNRPQWRSRKLAQNEFQKAVRTLNGHYVKRDYFRNKAENSARWCRYRAHCEVSKSAFLRTLLKRVYVFWGCEQKNRFKANRTKNSGFLFCLFIFFPVYRRFVITEIHSCNISALDLVTVWFFCRFTIRRPLRMISVATFVCFAYMDPWLPRLSCFASV